MNMLSDIPGIIERWSPNNSLELEGLSTGSGRLATWNCIFGHSFNRVIRKYIKSSICPICKGIKVVPGENDCLTLFPSLASIVHEKDLILLSSIGISSTKFVNWSCVKCKESFSKSLSSYLASTGKCRSCRHPKRNFSQNSTIADAYPHLVNMWSSKNELSSLEVPYGSSKYWEWICKKGHEFSAVAHKMNRKTKEICPICNFDVISPGVNDLNTLYPKISEQWSSENSLKSFEIGPGSNYLAKLKCIENGHKFNRSVVSHVIAKGRCPECRVIPWGSSLLELEVLEYVKSIIEEVYPNKRIEVINRDKSCGVEIDIWIPELKLGIEVNGNYWHSDKMASKIFGVSANERHQMKIKSVLSNQSQLAYIWESDWKQNRKAVEEAIRSLLSTGKLDPILRILSKG